MNLLDVCKLYSNKIDSDLADLSKEAFFGAAAVRGLAQTAKMTAALRNKVGWQALGRAVKKDPLKAAGIAFGVGMEGAGAVGTYNSVTRGAEAASAAALRSPVTI
jgi:hypothetical protein